MIVNPKTGLPRYRAAKAMATIRAKVQQEARKKAILDRRAAGWKMQRIADFYGISRERVRQILDKAGEP